MSHGGDLNGVSCWKLVAHIVETMPEFHAFIMPEKILHAMLKKQTRYATGSLQFVIYLTLPFWLYLSSTGMNLKLWMQKTRSRS
jgi:hypothetical protein